MRELNTLKRNLLEIKGIFLIKDEVLRNYIFLFQRNPVLTSNFLHISRSCVVILQISKKMRDRETVLSE